MIALSAQHDDLAGLEWRAVPDWPEYEISERGDLRRAKAEQGTRAGRLLRPWRNKRTGYFQISLWRGNRRHRTTVHQLVALTFLGQPPSPKHLVAHSDGCRTHNHWTNLRWATQRENIADTVLHGTHNRGSRNGQAKIDRICVVAIRKMAAMRIPQRVAANGFGLSRQTVGDIVNRKRWRSVP
ncbi:MAG: HNH endonuclease [Hyphomicrobiales bacterium]|nr:HNH endonuclease [Hyphomicrobiales bacterium]